MTSSVFLLSKTTKMNSPKLFAKDLNISSRNLFEKLLSKISQRSVSWETMKMSSPKDETNRNSASHTNLLPSLQTNTIVEPRMFNRQCSNSFMIAGCQDTKSILVASFSQLAMTIWKSTPSQKVILHSEVGSKLLSTHQPSMNGLSGENNLVSFVKKSFTSSRHKKI